MNDQERQIISDIFKRLESAADQPRDTEAERFIADRVRAQPYATYAMAQSLYVQEEAMKSLGQQLDRLKAENEQLRQSASQGSGGFLSSLFGGGQRPAPSSAFSRGGPQPGYAPQPQYAPQQGGPWGGQPQGGPPQGGPQGGAPQGGPWAGQQGGMAQPQPQGGGFLRGALTTAAGVAGGMMVGNALMSAFSGGHHNTLGSLSDSAMSSLGGGTGFGGSDAGSSLAGFDQGGFDQGGFGQGGFDQGGSDGGSFQDASFDPGGDIADDDSSWT